MGKVIGIDLGTTNSVVAVMEGAIPSSSPTRKGAASPLRWSPSPRTARSSSARSPSARPSRTRRTPSSRSSGSWAGATTRCEQEIKLVPYKVVKAPNGDVRIEIRGKQYSPPEISAMILPQAQGGRRGPPGREGHPGRHHRAGVFQRQPAPGHQGRREDRGPRGAAHHQRAHRGRARLRARQEEGRGRSPCTTWAAGPSTSPSSSSARASSR